MSMQTGQKEKMERYYRLHAPVYDLTRWSFLFGRKAIVGKARRRFPAARRILEVGCGTGKNLVALAHAFPNAQITGMDISDAMVAKAAGRCSRLPNVAVRTGGYSTPLDAGTHDLILFSYCLTMINPGFESLLEAARADLSDEGLLLLVDFHTTDHPWFGQWMRKNHVRMEGQVVDALPPTGFEVVEKTVRPAYGGLWNYFTVVARKLR